MSEEGASEIAVHILDEPEELPAARGIMAPLDDRERVRRGMMHEAECYELEDVGASWNDQR